MASGETCAAFVSTPRWRAQNNERQRKMRTSTCGASSCENLQRRRRPQRQPKRPTNRSVACREAEKAVRREARCRQDLNFCCSCRRKSARRNSSQLRAAAAETRANSAFGRRVSTGGDTHDRPLSAAAPTSVKGADGDGGSGGGAHFATSLALRSPPSSAPPSRECCAS